MLLLEIGLFQSFLMAIVFYCHNKRLTSYIRRSTRCRGVDLSPDFSAQKRLSTVNPGEIIFHVLLLNLSAHFYPLLILLRPLFSLFPLPRRHFFYGEREVNTVTGRHSNVGRHCAPLRYKNGAAFVCSVLSIQLRDSLVVFVIPTPPPPAVVDSILARNVTCSQRIGND